MCAFLEFCYIAQHEVYNTDSLTVLDDALQQFHHYCEIFKTTSVCMEGFNLLKQHALTHYIKLICDFGAPNSLCSSITESKHIKVLHPTSGTPRNSTGSEILDPLRSSDQYIIVSSFILSHLISSFMLLFSLLHTCVPLYPSDLSRTSGPLPCILLVYKP